MLENKIRNEKLMNNINLIAKILIITIIISIFAIYIIYTNLNKIEKENRKIKIFNEQIIEDQTERKITTVELATLINKMININKKNISEDVENKYIPLELLIKFKNNEYIAGRENSNKYIELNLENLKEKNNEEFTYIFGKSEFEITKIEKTNKGRIKKITIEEIKN